MPHGITPSNLGFGNLFKNPMFLPTEANKEAARARKAASAANKTAANAAAAANKAAANVKKAAKATANAKAVENKARAQAKALVNLRSVANANMRKQVNAWLKHGNIKVSKEALNAWLARHNHNREPNRTALTAWLKLTPRNQRNIERKPHVASSRVIQGKMNRAKVLFKRMQLEPYNPTGNSKARNNRRAEYSRLVNEIAANYRNSANYKSIKR